MSLPLPVPVPELPPNNNTYSQCIRLGNLLFVSGQLGVDPATRELASTGIAEQTARAIDNIELILHAAGSALDRVAKVNIFIVDFSLLAEMNRVYGPRFPHQPAKTTVEINRLDKGGLIEIEVVAAA